MWRRFLQWVMDRRPTKVYGVGDDPLFYRAYLFTFCGWVFYLHHYLRSDPDNRGLHDHPMRALAVILAGGYDEERIVGFGKRGPIFKTHARRPGRAFYIDEWTFHRVIIEPKRFWAGHGIPPYTEQPTSWSLFASRYVPGKSWGFLAKVPQTRRVPRHDTTSYMVYQEAGDGIAPEDPWWRTAPNGKEVVRG